MDNFVINGGHELFGEVNISGAKNAAVAIIPAALLAEDTVRIENIPKISDVQLIIEILSRMGAEIKVVNKNTLDINTTNINYQSIPYELTSHFRASYYLIGAMLGRFNKADVALPGGCDFGVRPIDQHVKGFKMLGAQVDIIDGVVCAKAEKLVGTPVYMDVVSVGATINIMLAAVKARGLTVIENAAKEPHVVDVANFLNSMGAKIRGAGTDVIRIKGVEKFGDCQYSIIPDQIEAGTFMTAAVATKGDIMIKNVIPKHLEAISAKLIEIGAEVVEFDDAVRVSATKRLESTNIKTLPYPGFPTDMQPQMAVTLALSNGTSVISESIFENRFRYVDELTKMGATIQVDGRTAIISGVVGFTGADVHAPDLRAGAALVIAGLSAKGFTTVSDIGYIYRGYEQFEQKLRQLGGEIQLVNNEKEVAKFKLKIG